MSPWEFMKTFKFNVPQNAALTKAREIYEQSLLLVQQYVRDGRLIAHLFCNCFRSVKI